MSAEREAKAHWGASFHERVPPERFGVVGPERRRFLRWPPLGPWKTTVLKLNRHVHFDLNYSTSDLQLLAGDLRTHLVVLRGTVALNTRMFGSSLVQWNSVTREFGVNVRLRCTYRPSSDPYVVFNERMVRPEENWLLRERRLIVKCTYLLRI